MPPRSPKKRPHLLNSRRKPWLLARRIMKCRQRESEFMQAMQEYKRISGRMFPTWSEVLEVLQSLGYRKIEPNSPNTLPTNEPA